VPAEKSADRVEALHAKLAPLLKNLQAVDAPLEPQSNGCLAVMLLQDSFSVSVSSTLPVLGCRHRV